MSKKIVVVIIVLAGIGALWLRYNDKLLDDFGPSPDETLVDRDDQGTPDAEAPSERPPSKTQPVERKQEKVKPAPAPNIKVSSKPRVTVRVLPRDVNGDAIAIQRRLRDRTELTVIGLPATGNLSAEQFDLMDLEGKRHPILGFLIYRFDGINWHRSDEDIRSPRKETLLQQTAGGLTYSMYLEGRVEVNEEQAIVLFLPEPGIRGRLFFKGDELDVVFDSDMTPPRTDPLPTSGAN